MYGPGAPGGSGFWGTGPSLISRLGDWTSDRSGGTAPACAYRRERSIRPRLGQLRGRRLRGQARDIGIRQRAGL